MTDFGLLRDKLNILPVTSIIDNVVRDVMDGRVTVVAASTGSGKSMILPGALADASGRQIVVLVPRRFLALDATYNVAELANVAVGAQVGYALGQMGGESSQRSPDTRVLYCTYGYALSSGLINKAAIVVLDEVHEADEMISLSRAILRERKTKDPSLCILEMSATVVASTQASYWHPIAQTAIHSIEGQRLSCEFVHEKPSQDQSRTIEDTAIGLIAEGRKGVAVFRPGVKEVENTVIALKEKFSQLGIKNVEVFGIHGGTPADERRLARAKPANGNYKIIVGTNVIESGVNLRWLDSAVSDGYRKVPYHRDDTGADALVLEHLPQAGLLQQMGRVNRDPASTGFEAGKFILYSKTEFETRALQNLPAIQRQSLLGISFYAACLGFAPTRLTWDISSQTHANLLPERFEQVRQDLLRLDLINEDWSLTKDGAFIKHLPVSPETGALLCEANRVDAQRMRDKHLPRTMRDAVIIAAILESHGLRDDIRKPHKCDQLRTSDLLDGLNAYRMIRKEAAAEEIMQATEEFLSKATPTDLAHLAVKRAALKILCEEHNVSLTGFVETGRLADEIGSRLQNKDKGVRVDVRTDDDKYDAERYGELQRCILCGGVNRLFQFDDGGGRDLLRDYDKHRSDIGQLFRDYKLSSASIVRAPASGTLLIGNLREIQANMEGNLVITNVSVVPDKVFITWVADRAAAYAPVLSETSLQGETLDAIYAQKAQFEMKLTHDLRDKARGLLG